MPSHAENDANDDASHYDRRDSSYYEVVGGTPETPCASVGISTARLDRTDTKGAFIPSGAVTIVRAYYGGGISYAHRSCACFPSASLKA